MSAKGDCQDKYRTQSFFQRRKVEEIHGQCFQGAPGRVKPYLNILRSNNKTPPAGGVLFMRVTDYFLSERIQLTSMRALPSVMATAFGGIDRPLTLPCQWLA